VSHASSAGHVTLGVYVHVLFEQLSVVQLLLSLHSAAIAAALFARVPHPLAGSQNDSRHWSVDAGHVTAVYTHVLFAHVSTVHALLSLHSALISAVDLSTSRQPVDGLHEGLLHMSFDVHNAPMSVVSH